MFSFSERDLNFELIIPLSIYGVYQYFVITVNDKNEFICYSYI